METVGEFLASFPFADTTKATYRRILEQLIRVPLLEQMTAAALVGFVKRPEWGSCQSYVALCACRRYLAWRFGPSHSALSARIKRTRPCRQRVLSADMALRLLALFDTSKSKGARDLAIAALALDTGLRLAELCRLRLLDVDLTLRTLQVIVKGGQWGVAVFSMQTALYISGWLSLRHPGADTLFVSTKDWQPLTREGLQTIVKKWGVQLGVKLSPHDLRRSFATLSTIFGAPSRIVQVAGRWSNIEMVEYYTREVGINAIEPYLPVSHLSG